MTTETRERITDPERLSRLEGAHEHMATKADLAATEARLMAKIAESNEKTAESEIRTAEKIAASEIRTAEKINSSERRLIMWGIGIAVSSITALAGIGMLLYRLLTG